MKRMPAFSLRTPEDLVEAYERVYSAQQEGQVDARKAAAMVSTLNGSTYLIARLPLQVAQLRLNAAKLMVVAGARKVQLPLALLPPEATPASAQPAKHRKGAEKRSVK